MTHGAGVGNELTDPSEGGGRRRQLHTLPLIGRFHGHGHRVRLRLVGFLRDHREYEIDRRPAIDVKGQFGTIRPKPFGVRELQAQGSTPQASVRRLDADTLSARRTDAAPPSPSASDARPSRRLEHSLFGRFFILGGMGSIIVTACATIVLSAL